MPSETADFASGAAIWRTGRNIRDVFDFGPFALLRQQNYKTGSTQRIAYPSHDLATATCTENLVKFGLCFSRYAS